MNGEFGRDENHCDDMEEEEEVILTHAEHKAQGNELYKSKGMFVLQIVRWPSLGCCMLGKRESRESTASDHVFDHICRMAKLAKSVLLGRAWS